ncbi:protein BPS1, chloroplastic-like [Carya illinoinensis]|uniref:protein BPS1, chloroplastic-like n=1 Tax=Carya illinoinensis TaxID=32201 RepID=UPI001C71DF11|nr:protein BPS1, chloroplastic-like [Carya illinoinensis]
MAGDSMSVQRTLELNVKSLLDLPKVKNSAKAFTGLQTSVNGEIRNILSSGRFPVLKELEAVDTSVTKFYPMIQDGVDPVEAEAFQNSVSDLGRRAEKLSQGPDLLTNEVGSFFQLVLIGRDAMLSYLRTSGTDSDGRLEGNGIERV